MGAPVNIDVGCQVWVDDPSVAWIDGRVISLQGQDAEIETSNETTVVSPISKLHLKEEIPPSGVDDMTKLAYLHEPGVLHNLAVRYEQNIIYTYTGNILIAVNPFQRLPPLYDTDVMEQYKGAQLGKLSPHVFAIADVAYRAMTDEGKRNSILVSGESGAGKTETTKMLMRYLAYLGGRVTSERRTVEQQVLESNPVLEAFGNAKTARNNNSSRFGKFVELQFDKHGRISGAAIRTYLLERSRVCQISDPERNYHCFYLLCAAPSQEIERYKLGSPKSFHYLNQSNCYELLGVNDAEDYLTTRRAMDIVGIGVNEQDAIFRVVAAILHLGNIDFAKGEDSDTSVVTEESRCHLQMTSELLMCDPQKLQDALCQRVMITPEEVITRSLDPHSAAISRDGLAKTIYSRLFDWLVNKINSSIGQDPSSKSLIGILDIYGFESFKTNSFEQFCINYTNEKLQQHFNQHVFKMEQEEYTKEEIDWSYIDFVDNQDILDLIEKKPGGIMALLDEACMFPKSTHETFSQKLYQTFKNHKRFLTTKLSRTDFTIAHYAGEVQYQSDHFLDKNKDYIVPEHQDLLSASSCSFVADLFPPLPEEMTKSSKFSSIGYRFKLQLQQLMETLNSTEPHYIRCVKPNSSLEPSVFENINVINQLRSGGVLEAIRISYAGYPTHRTFAEFIERFAILAVEVLKEGYDEKEACIKILEKTGITGSQIGKTKVLLRAGHMAELDLRRSAKRNNAAKVIQKHTRGRIARREYTVMRKSSIHLQSAWRKRLAWKEYVRIGKERNVAAIRIQKHFRGHRTAKGFNCFNSSVIIIQSSIRAMADRRVFRHRMQIKAATTIQSHWRRHRDYTDYQKLRKISMISQNRWRGKRANRTTVSNKTESLEVAKENLEHEVDELRFNLHHEHRRRTDLEEARSQETIDLQHSLEAMRSQVDETNALLLKERQAAQKVVDELNRIKGRPSLAKGSSGELDLLVSEVENLKALLLSEKQRSEDLEKKYLEALETSEERRKKLDEAERRVHELQESLDRMLYSMSNQVAELKMLLHTSSISNSTSGSLPRVEQMDAVSTSSDASSSASDFTFPAPPLTSGSFSTAFNSNGLQLIVKDVSAGDNSG
ncbi:hypothetical protein QQ045_024001 [Rhodiola kirilowii]